jgi:hypothetical protein
MTGFVAVALFVMFCGALVRQWASTTNNPQKPLWLCIDIFGSTLLIGGFLVLIIGTLLAT